ncbi:two-component system sensor histidine kinase YesM [Anaerobacterium chartisolvens]|uniref:histidine kinase n=1 Tax=Anaerobacterium chartisolvens TaxID=1297424 RepID=A0A369B3M0_9FIRM|nr:sensor histidine kinase [Anaerobacterium chartisolvens]RCX16031.1 two-component system sensor histidine kinase YesM [Anaerobacterium chartisolvens]
MWFKRLAKKGSAIKGNRGRNYRHIRKTTISGRFIRIFIVIFLIPLLAGGVVSYVIQSEASRKNAITVNHDINTRTNMNLEMMLQGIERVANDIAFNENIQSTLIDYEKSGKAPLSGKMVELKSILLDAQIKTDYLVSNIVLFSYKGFYFTDINFYKDWFNVKDYHFGELLSKSHGENIWIQSHIDKNDTKTGAAHVITLVKKIRVSKGDDMGVTIGYLLINVKESELYKLLHNFDNQSEELMLVGPDSKIISNKDKSMIGKSFDLSQISGKSAGNYFTKYNGVDCLIVYSWMKKTGWYLVGIHDTEIILRDSTQYLYIAIIVTSILFLIFVFIITLISRRISRPIIGLYKQMKKVENGDFDVTFDKHSDTMEVDELIRGFNVMVYKLNNLINEVYEAEIKKKQLEIEVKQADLEALQQQINPHFLYNTLDCINWMASLEGNENVSNMILALGNYFRSSVHRGKNFVTVEEEVKNIKDYLYIQSIRYRFKFNADIKVQPEALRCRTMKLLLQPLVENSIIHGIEPKAGTATITIDISISEDRLIIIVSDNGVGMPPEVLNKILYALPEKGGSIGLRNVLERLKLYYGEDTYKIESVKGEGTAVTINIPCFESTDKI